MDIGEDLLRLWFDSPISIFKSEFTYFSIWSDYSDFNTDLEEEADVNEEGNEDCSAVL